MPVVPPFSRGERRHVKVFVAADGGERPRDDLKSFCCLNDECSDFGTMVALALSLMSKRANTVFVERHPEGVRPDFYMANDGDLICVSNFESAMLDLPVNSPQSDGARAWAANTERIPPRDTKVTVYLEPIPAEKK